MSKLPVFTSVVLTFFCVLFHVITADNIENSNFLQVPNPDNRCLEGSAPRFISHESDCSFFYACVNGHAVLKECSKNLHFNARKSVCDYPQNAGCKKDTTRLPPQGRIGGRISDIDCPSENGRHTVLKPHATDCEQYYICDNGVPHLRTCQPGLHFNPSAQACDFPESAGCDTGVPKTPREQVVGENSHLECPEKNGKVPVLKSHSMECGKFYICDNGVPHLKACQAGLHFNPKIQACDYPENAGCEANGILKDQLSKKGRLLDDFTMSCPTVRSDVTVLVPHPSDCSKFFMCDQGQSHLRTCPSGLHFNRILQECNYPDKAKCEEMGRLLSVGLPSPFCPTLSGKIPVFYGHPTNCSIYYLCSNGLAYEFACPSRLHFNLRQKICDYESLARCPSGEKK